MSDTKIKTAFEILHETLEMPDELTIDDADGLKFGEGHRVSDVLEAMEEYHNQFSARMPSEIEIENGANDCIGKHSEEIVNSLSDSSITQWNNGYFRGFEDCGQWLKSFQTECFGRGDMEINKTENQEIDFYKEVTDILYHLTERKDLSYGDATNMLMKLIEISSSQNQFLKEKNKS